MPIRQQSPAQSVTLYMATSRGASSGRRWGCFCGEGLSSIVKSDTRGKAIFLAERDRSRPAGVAARVNFIMPSNRNSFDTMKCSQVLWGSVLWSSVTNQSHESERIHQVGRRNLCTHGTKASARLVSERQHSHRELGRGSILWFLRWMPECHTCWLLLLLLVLVLVLVSGLAIDVRVCFYIEAFCTRELLLHVPEEAIEQEQEVLHWF